uniref:T9SS type A sorting domain-containing protein n=1 Tax=candidate division WOR-3 bacterium TaxID=2052148 RepID=A0A7C6A9M1_UNCW3
MKKVILLCCVIVFILAASGKEKEQKIAVKAPNQPMIESSEIGDANPTIDPIVQRLYEAKKNRNWTAYHQLLNEWRSQIPTQETNEPGPQAINPLERPLLRWGEDRVIYAGDVAYDIWSMENEAISVDHHRGDTLRAAVVTADSTISVFQSTDNGETWSWFAGWRWTGRLPLEPEIINDPLGRWYHVFCIWTGNNNDLGVFTDSTPGGWFWRNIEAGADTTANYTVCSDRADYPDEYWLFCAFHKKLGGQGRDEIWFSRSFDCGATWETLRRLCTNGSGFPDLVYGDNDYLYETHIWDASDTNNYVRVWVSTDLGNSWTIDNTLQSDTTTKMGPQIAAAHDGSGDAWVVWARSYPNTTPPNFDLLFSWSQDYGANWSHWAWFDADNIEHTLLPSIAIYDSAGAYLPYVTYNCIDTNQTNPKVYCKSWETDSTWSDRETFNDSEPAFNIRPVQTFEVLGIPAIAYVGAVGHNVYYDAWSIGGVEEQNKPISEENLLSQNQPNPFTNKTRLEYFVPQNGRVTLKIYNTLGKEVAKLIDEDKKAGAYAITLNRENLGKDVLPAGVYFLKLEVNKSKATRKIIIQ